MTFAEMAAEFYTLIDKPYTGFFSPASLSDIFNRAQTNVVERLYDRFQLAQGVPDEIGGLVVNEELTVNATQLDLTANLSYPYRHYLTSELIYEVDGEDYPAVPYLPTEGMRFVKDPFDSPDITQPFLRIFNDLATGERKIAYFYPTDTPVKTFRLAYLRAPDAINPDDNQNSPAYNTKMQRQVIMEAVNIAGYALRDNDLYQTSQNEIVENP